MATLVACLKVTKGRLGSVWWKRGPRSAYLLHPFSISEFFLHVGQARGVNHDLERFFCKNSPV
ncbi:Uncharacterised protein [Alcaligenes faecalis]|nr:hypothetical protein UZ73_05385 [Alcaligenes faecalis]GAU73198.1 hypothetical protein AFA2_01529 [Alcaligenes faecalis subsp. faecalis NBRC 13111]ARP52932.1 hypothetical protein ALFP_1045 [Alcaligenes faecalis]ATH98936.1 hypothetical protein CPY64_03915 [Alcaligenes faecalis]AYZ91722.1 hypothetical protein EGY22_09680 [Alcaligenes faecalis]